MKCKYLTTYVMLLKRRERVEKNSNQLFPATENEDSDSSDPSMHMKDVKKKDNEKWTPK